MSCDFLCGWVGGCSGLVLGHPLDTLKVRQQSLGTRSVLATVREAHSSGLYSTLRRGLAFPLFSAGAINSVFFGVYGLGLSSLTETGEKPGYSQVFLAGCLGGAGQLVLACPVDLVKVRLQSHQGLTPLPPSPPGATTSLARRLGMGAPYNCLHTVYSQGGVRGCYRGLVPQAFRDVKASGLYFLIYQYTMDTISSRLSTPSTLLHSFWAGGLAGVLSWQSIIYLDVVKSRVQADCPTHPKYRNTWHCVTQSYRKEGVGVFFRGFTLMSSRAFVVNGATFVAYEYCMNICKGGS